MTEIDQNTGYPPGYEPGEWVCVQCDARWHDSEQRGLDVSWDVPTECGDCELDMVRVVPLSTYSPAVANLHDQMIKLYYRVAHDRALLAENSRLLQSVVNELTRVEKGPHVRAECGYCGYSQLVSEMEFGDTSLPAASWRCTDAGDCDARQNG